MKEIPAPTPSQKDLLHRVTISYGIGIAGPAFLVSIPQALLTFPFVLIFGLILGLPVLLVALIVAAVFRDNIDRNPGWWCIFAPVLAGLSAAVVVVLGFGLQLCSDEAKIYALTTLVCAAVSSAAFYRMSREDPTGSSDPGVEVWT